MFALPKVHPINHNSNQKTHNPLNTHTQVGQRSYRQPQITSNSKHSDSSFELHMYVSCIDCCIEPVARHVHGYDDWNSQGNHHTPRWGVDSLKRIFWSELLKYLVSFLVVFAYSDFPGTQSSPPSPQGSRPVRAMNCFALQTMSKMCLGGLASKKKNQRAMTMSEYLVRNSSL